MHTSGTAAGVTTTTTTGVVVTDAVVNRSSATATTATTVHGSTDAPTRRVDRFLDLGNAAGCKRRRASEEGVHVVDRRMSGAEGCVIE